MIRSHVPALAAGLISVAALAACAPAVPIVGAGALLGGSVIEERGTLTALEDADIALGVSTRLSNHSGELFRDVHVDVIEAAVLLSGSVPRPEDKLAAVQAAWATPGVAAVADEITVAGDSGTRAYLRDVAISTTVRYRLTLAAGVQVLNYTVTTIDGRTHLSGIARSRAELARAIEIAATVEGVEEVVSHVLTIDDPRRVARIARGG
ncbi:MAG: BON domain-containing protein [Pikeienuella sp.]